MNWQTEKKHFPSFLKKLRLKQRENHIVDSIADILVEFFSALSSQRLKSAYGEFSPLQKRMLASIFALGSVRISCHVSVLRKSVITVSMESILCN